MAPDGRYKLSYTFSAKSPLMSRWHNEQGLEPVPADADWVVEQEAYYQVRDGRISWMTILCYGYHRPMDEDRGLTRQSPWSGPTPDPPPGPEPGGP